MDSILGWSRDAHLVRGTLRGDKNAFCRLVERHLTTVEAVAYACTRSRTEAEDISQEAFLKAYQSLDTLKNASKFGSWVATIARNLGLNQYAKRSKEEPLTAEVAASLVSPTHDHEQQELFQLLHAHVLDLPEDTREVLLLHYYAGQSLREAAATLGISRDAAAKRLQRGRDTLSADMLRALGETKRSPERDRARAKQFAVGAVTSVAAWEASAASAGIAQWTLLAAAFKPTVAASIITATAFVSFFSYLAIVARHADGEAPAPREQIGMKLAAQASAPSATAPQPAAEKTKPPRPTTGPGSITVTVTSGQGQAAEGATVYVELIDWPEFTYPPSETFRKEAVADASGIARFTRLPLGLYAIVAKQENMMWGDYTMLGEKSTHSDSGLPLRLGKPIDGTVIDSAGNPVPNAVVYPHSSPWILNVPWGIFSSLRMVSDEKGTIHLDCLPTMPLRFCIVADGYARTLTGQFTHGNGPLQMVILRGGSFSGTVVDAETNQPVPRIALEIHGDYTVNTIAIESGENGQFTSPNLQAGNYQIALKEEGYTYSGPVSVDVNEGEVTANVEVKLVMGGTISGYVRDAETGEGIAGATVIATASAQPSRASAPTDASGAYVVFGLAEATYSLGAGAEGYFGGGLRDGIAAQSGQDIVGIDFSLNRGFLIRGRVLEKDGRGATTAHIHSVTEDGERITTKIATTDGRGGTFELLLPHDAEAIWLKAYTMFGSTDVVGPIEATDEDATDITLRASIPRDCEMTGVVVNSNGTPIPFIDVWAFIVPDPVYSEVSSRQGFTDQSGRFTMPKLHPGRYRMVAGYGQGGQVADVSVDIRDGHSEHDVVIVFSRMTKSVISGRVIDTNGKPVSGAEITVQAPSYGQFTTDANGEFKVARTMNGDYLLKVAHANYSTVYLDPLTEDANSVSVVLQNRASLEGRVLDADTGKPIAQFELSQRVEGARAEGEQARSFSDSEGKFKLARAESGQTVLHVHADGYQPEQVELDLAPGASKSGIEVRLRPGGIVTGMVVSSDGGPVADVEVLIGDSTEPEMEPGLRTRTNARGEFQLTGLPLEDLSITARHHAYARATVRVQPSGGEGTNVTIALPQTRALYAAVTLNGAPASGAYLTAEVRADTPEAAIEAVTDASGRAYFGEIVRGNFHIVAQVRIGTGLTWLVASTNTYVELSGPDHDVAMELSTGSSVIAGAVASNGVPLAGEMIAVQCAGGQLVTYTQNDGSYRIEGVPAGNLTVSSGPRLDRLASRGMAQVEEGQVATLDFAL